MLESWHEPKPQESGDAGDKPGLSRRTLLAGSGGAVIAAAGSTSAPGIAMDASWVEQAALEHRATVVLQDRRLLLPDVTRQRLSANGVRLLTLEGDPVRMWRGAHATLLGSADTRLLGVTPWIEFVMIRGLAAESRRRVRYQRFDAGNNALVWLIA
jgi:hypothetical protein